jgi:CRP/FNR family transcriptional regulator
MGPSFSKNKQLSCRDCVLGNLCLPCGLNTNEMDKLENIIESANSYSTKSTIYRSGEPFKKVYAVKSGMIETVMTDAHGEDHILGFYLPGELFGLDAVHPNHYISSAIALASSVVCSINFQRLSELAASVPSLQQQLLCIMSKEMQPSLTAHGEFTAEQKLAHFLLSLSKRYKLRGYSEKRFQLLMPRKDIANHLGMAPETVSRLLRKLMNEGIIDIQTTEIIVNDLAKLWQRSGVNNTDPDSHTDHISVF